MRQQSDIVALLKSTELFCGLPSCAQFPYFIAQYKKGQRVHDCPNGEKMLGIVLTGELQVLSPVIDGNEVMLKKLYAKDMFGVCNLFAQSELPSLLYCVCETEVLYIPKRQIVEWMEDNHNMLFAFLKFYNERILFLQRKIEQLNTHSARARLCEHILDQAQNGTYVKKGSHESLYLSLGISRASFYRELSKLKTQSFVHVEKRAIHIKDKKALLEYAYAKQ